MTESNRDDVGLALSELLAWIAHELNNPLGVILGRLPGLMRKAPEQEEALAALQRNARRCAEVVHALDLLSQEQGLGAAPLASDDLVRSAAAQLAEVRRRSR